MVQTLFDTGSGDPHMDKAKEVSDGLAPGKVMPLVMLCSRDPKLDPSFDPDEDQVEESIMED